VAAVKPSGTFRWAVLGILGLYFLVPMVASVQFSLEAGYDGRLSVTAYRQALSEAGLGSSLATSVEVSLGAMAVTLALLIPTVVFVNLRFPRWRAVLDAISLLPLGVPSVVIVLGVLGAYRGLPAWFTGTPVILALVYVILALPYSYRAIDASVRAIDLVTLVDAGRSMGAGWRKLFARLLLPNLRPGILAAAFLTVALSLGEFAIASIMGFNTFPVWLVGVEGNNPYVAVALSIAALVITWLLLVGLAIVGSGRRRRTGAFVGGLVGPGADVEAPVVEDMDVPTGLTGMEGAA
jgi:putative spermidine/putrescine transport system permease protein